MKRRTLGAAGLIGIALAATVRARGADEGVLLRYRFQPGQEYRYRMTVNGDLPITPGAGAPPGGVLFPGPIPSTMKGTYEWVQRVKSVSPEGVATVSLSLDKMDLTTSVLGMSIVARLG